MPVALPLDPAAISLNDLSHSKKRVLERAAQLLGQHDQEMVDLIFERLLERERLGSTGMANGVALPHVRMTGIQECQAAFVRLDEAIDFDSLDGQPTDLVFALIVPEEATEKHLQLLAKFAQLLGNAETREAIRKAQNAADIPSILLT